MGIEKISHYSLTSPASVYDEEALTALELAGRTAQKVNEVVDEVNQIPDKVEKEVQRQIDNGTFENQIDEYANGLKESLEKGIAENNQKITTTANTKVDKNGVGQVTWGMLAQDARENITGGNTAVVGTDSVTTENIVNNSVTLAKLEPNMHTPIVYNSVEGGMDIPFLFIDSNTKTVELNSAISDLQYNFICQDGSKIAVYGKVLTVDSSFWGGSTSFELYIHPSTAVIYIAPYFIRNDTLKQCWYLGGITGKVEPYTNAIPVVYNGLFVPMKHVTTPSRLSNVLKRCNSFITRTNIHPNGAYFDFNTTTEEVTLLVDGKVDLFNNEKTYNINFATLTVEVVKGSANKAVFYDPVNNKMVFDAISTTINDNYNEYLYLGHIDHSKTRNASTLCIPFSIDDELYIYPNKTGRETAILHFAWGDVDQTQTKPCVDFVGRKLIIPPHVSCFAMWKNGFQSIGGSSEETLEIPFATNGYNYLCGSPSGLKFVSSTDFNALNHVLSKDETFYFGYISESTKTVNFTFDCEIGKTVSILGDSISTFKDYIPEGNTNHYSGSNGGVSHVNQTWWKRAMNACGMILNTNNSFSGDRVTNRAMTRASALDNGTDPDIILVYMGINDFNGGVALGTYNGKGTFPTTGNTFREAYAIMLDNMMTAYPQAKIYCLTLPTCQRTSADVKHPEVNGAGVYLSEYNEAIREVALALGASIIETATCGITNKNASVTMGDYATDTGLFLHPNKEGHRLISQKVIQALKNSCE